MIAQSGYIFHPFQAELLAEHQTARETGKKIENGRVFFYLVDCWLKAIGAVVPANSESAISSTNT
jgi:hypothetical protein